MKTDKLYRIFPWALFILGTLAYVSLIFNNNVWMDEAFTASLVNTDMAGVIARSMSDTLPPLYNIYLKIITDILGYTVPVMKLASIIPMVLTMLLSVTVIRKRHGNLVSSLYTASLFAMPLMLHFGIEIRMYSLGFFFATASGIYAYEVLYDSNRRNWIMFTVLSVLAGYSHHFAFVTVGAVYLYILLYYIIRDRAHIRRFFICLAATFVLYLPCLIVTLKQLSRVSGYFSMPDVTLSVFINYMYYPYTVGLTPVSVLLMLTVIALFVYCLVTILKNREEASVHMYALFMFLIYYGVLIFGTAISKVMTANIFVDRYLFFATGLIWLFFCLMGNSLAESLRKIPGIIAYSVLLIFVLIIGIISYRIEYRAEYDVNPDEMISYLEENVSENDALIVSGDTEALIWCMLFYSPKLKLYNGIDDAMEGLTTGQYQNIWIAVDTADSTLEEVLDAATIKTEPVHIDDFSFDRYNMELYRISGQTIKN